MASNFQPGIPTGTVPLDVDYQNLQGNFQQLDTSFGVDHKKFSDTSGFNGYHTVIHLANNSTTSSGNNNFPPVVPTPVVGTSELYSSRSNDGISADSNLTFQSANGLNVLLTRNFLPLPVPNPSAPNTAPAFGKTFLPGGMIMQWGVITIAPGATKMYPTNPYLFNTNANNITFPNNCFIIFPVLNIVAGGKTGTTNVIAIDPSTVTNAGFKYQFVVTANNFASFSWLAIGN
jgi:hypothetical protein